MISSTTVGRHAPTTHSESTSQDFQSLITLFTQLLVVLNWIMFLQFFTHGTKNMSTMHPVTSPYNREHLLKCNKTEIWDSQNGVHKDSI
jgi:hypothetical protein